MVSLTDLPRSDFFDIIKRHRRGPGPAIHGHSAKPVSERSSVSSARRSTTQRHSHSQGLSNVPKQAATVTDPKLRLLGELFGIPELIPKPENTYRARSGKLWDVSLPTKTAEPHAYVSAEVRPASVKFRAVSPGNRRRRFLHPGLSSRLPPPKEVRQAFLPGSYNDIGALAHDLTRVLTMADLKIKGSRGVITEFSEKSRTRLASVCADLQALGVKPGFMLTLTYPGAWQSCVPDGKESKRHLHAMRKRLTRYLKRQGFGPWSALWFAEFQTRGAPHYHMIGWGPLLKYADMRRIRRWSLDAWADIISHPDPVHRARGRKAGTKFERMRKEHFGYAAKYASKMQQKSVPDGYSNVGRFWGLWNYKLPPPLVLDGQMTRADLFKLTCKLAATISKHSTHFTSRIFNQLTGPNSLNEIYGGEYLDKDFEPDTCLTVFGQDAARVVALALDTG